MPEHADIVNWTPFVHTQLEKLTVGPDLQSSNMSPAKVKTKQRVFLHRHF